MTTSSGAIHAREKCKNGEQKLAQSELIGPQGLQGIQGAQGPQGADGVLRVYGDGSAGAKTFTSSTTFQDSNPQYTDVTIAAGVTLTVPSGVVIRCSGTFTNLGTITVLPGLRDTSRFGENGMNSNVAASSPLESPGGVGGAALPGGVAKSLLSLGLVAGGNGFRDSVDSGGDGGGNFTVLCKGALQNAGTITADGLNATTVYRGGGGGGFIILASASSVSNAGTIRANGADGGAFVATDSNSTGHGGGGGGGGGIVHLIAPSITTSGVIEVNGGLGGAAAGAGSITGFAYSGGGGGGGSGGKGGDGGIVNPGNIGDTSVAAAEDGNVGQILQTTADPASLF